MFKKLYIRRELSLNLINVKQIICVEINELTTIYTIWNKQII